MSNIWNDVYKSLSIKEIGNRVDEISKSKYVFQKQNQLIALKHLSYEKSARIGRENKVTS